MSLKKGRTKRASLSSLWTGTGKERPNDDFVLIFYYRIPDGDFTVVLKADDRDANRISVYKAGNDSEELELLPFQKRVEFKAGNLLNRARDSLAWVGNCGNFLRGITRFVEFCKFENCKCKSFFGKYFKDVSQPHK